LWPGAGVGSSLMTKVDEDRIQYGSRGVRI